MTQLRVLIADDEAMARRRLARLLDAFPGVEVVGEVDDAEGVLQAVRAGGVDLVLLDIQMPGLTGIDVRALMPKDGPAVVFCTAHAEHAVAAFDVGAVDYLLKPIEAGRLSRAVERARIILESRPAASEAPMPARLAVESRQGVLLLDPADISHASLDDTLVTLHTSSGPVLCDLAIGELERRLAPHGLLRVHRRTLLNLAHVLRLEPTDAGGYLARTTRGVAVEVSRASARDLRRRLGLR